MSNIAAIVGGVIGSLVIFTAGTLGVKYLISTKGKNSDNSFVQESDGNKDNHQDKIDLGQDRKKVFERTQELCKFTSTVRDDQFKIYALYNSEQKEAGDKLICKKSGKRSKKNEGRIFVNNGDSIGGVYDVISENNLNGGKIGIFNFANYTLCGGGVKKGCSAQEEELFRRTNASKMWENSKLMRMYYGKNKKFYDVAKGASRGLGVEDLTYFIGGEKGQYYELPQNQWKKVDMIIVAAPDLRNCECEESEIKNRIRLAVEMAREMGIETFSVGALGCGVYKWKPEVVAKKFKEVLVDENCRKYFKNVIFNICGGDPENFEAFKREFTKPHKKDC